nr:O-antigen ligase family protein [[Pseudomonas] sp. BICA1-14]
MADLTLLVCGFLSLAMNAALVIYLGKYRALSLPFFVALLLVFSIPNTISPIFFKLYDDEVYLIASFISSLFFLFYFLLSVCFVENGVVSKISNGSLTVDVAIYYVSLFLFSSSFLLFLALFKFDFSLMMSSGWLDFRNNHSVLKLLATYLLCPASGLLIVSIVLRKKIGILLVLSYLFFSVVVLKTRGYIVLIVLPCLFYFIMFGRWNFRRLVVFVVVAFLFTSLYSLSREIRHLGSIENISDVTFKIDTQEFELVDNLYYLINRRDEIYTSSFNDIKRLLLLPFPSDVLPFSKPRENAKVLWDERTGITEVEGSLHPNFFGNVAAESILFGWFVYAFFLSVVFLVFHKAFFFLRSANLIVFSSIVAASFYIARGAFFNGVMLVVFSLGVAFLAELVLRACNRRLQLNEKYRV